MNKSKTKKSQAGYSWAILLGMSGVPILALLSKVFPHLDALWAVLLAVFGLIIARSVIGLLFAGAPAGGKKSARAVRQSAAQSR